MPLPGIYPAPLSCQSAYLQYATTVRRVRPWRRAYSRGLSHMGFHAAAANCASSRHSILRLWRGPSPRAYSRGTISYGLSCRCGELCLFEALYPAPLARPFSKGLRAGIISHGLSCHHWDENRYSDPPLFFLHQFQRRCKVADEFPLPPAEVVIDDSDTGEVKFHCRTTGGE